MFYIIENGKSRFMAKVIRASGLLSLRRPKYEAGVSFGH
jgi:hypothetical protein